MGKILAFLRGNILTLLCVFLLIGASLLAWRLLTTPLDPHIHAEYAVMHHVDYEILQPRRAGEQSFMFVGLPHPQALRYLEVGVAVDGRGRRTIFHVMEVTDLYRHLVPPADH